MLVVVRQLLKEFGNLNTNLHGAEAGLHLWLRNKSERKIEQAIRVFAITKDFQGV